MVTAFLPDGRYMQARVVAGDAVHTGLEFGTYSWNPGTGAIMASSLVDTNGNWGLAGDVDGTQYVTVTGNTATVFQPGCAGGCAFTVNRVETGALQPLIIKKSGTGTVTGDSGGINCGSVCTASFVSSNVVTLTATPAAGFAFAGWGGACTGTATCVVSMISARNVTASFRAVPFQTTITGVTAGIISNNPATVSNTITFNAADIGKTGRTFVTAWVPVGSLATFGIVAPARDRQKSASTDKSRLPARAGDAANGAVLIQLTASGWQQVSNGQLIPYASGVLNSQLASQNILNNTSTTTLAGAQFCVGYGTSAAEMSVSWRMQTIAVVPAPNATASASASASGTCNVFASVNGWWWNANEGGRGYFIEMKNGKYFASSYLYDDGGNPVWYVTGPGDAFTDSLSGTLSYYSGGQTLTGTWKSPVGPIGVGNYSISFSDANHGTITWPGGSVAITRYLFGDASTAPAFQPETGWWWNADEGGRGFSVEVQGNQIFVAGFMYDGSGNPVWYVSGGPMTTPNLYVGTWMQYGGGQTMTGAWKSAWVANPNVGTATFNFDSTTTGTLQLPNGRQVRLTRFAF